MMKPPKKPIRVYENFHIVLWLLKDFSWVFGFKILGLIMITPAVGMAVYITWLLRSNRSELFHNLAVCLWISGNSVWMIGEFFFQDRLRDPAKLFFIAGLLILLYYYLWVSPIWVKKKSQDSVLSGQYPGDVFSNDIKLDVDR